MEGKICTISIGASSFCVLVADAAADAAGSLLPCGTLCCSGVAAASEVTDCCGSIGIAVLLLLLFNWLLLEETFKAPSVLLLTVVRDSSKYSSEEDGVDSEDDD